MSAKVGEKYVHHFQLNIVAWKKQCRSWIVTLHSAVLNFKKEGGKQKRGKLF
jgi:hypothetical protein